MSTLFNLFADNILPIILIAGIGVLLQRTLHIDPRTLSRVIFYALTPAFVFSLLINAELEANDILFMAGFTVVVSACVGGISWLLSRIFHLNPQMTSAFMLTTIFMNSGNYGLSLNSFALGDLGLTWASIYFITSSMLLNSVGVYIATVGRTPALKALLGLLKVPAVYAIPLALFLRLSGVTLPIPLWRPISLLGSAAVPLMIILLGMQIARAGIPRHRNLLAASAIIRLLVAPMIAWGIASLLGLGGVARQAGILESAMPSAVLSTVIATEFDIEPEFVTGVVLATTLLSPLTLTPLLALIGV